MDKLVGDVDAEETDPENDFAKDAVEDADENIVSTGPSSKQIDASESDNSKKEVKPFEENKNPNIEEPKHDDPNLYVVRKKPKRAIPGQKPEKATEIQQRVGQENLTTQAPQQQQRPPPALLKMAAMIWRKSADRPQGQFTKPQALAVAKKIWVTRQR